MMKKYIWLFAGGGIMLCGFLTLLTFIFLDYTTSRAMPTIPLVLITDTYPEGAASADQPVVVFGQASDPDGITEVQLWVNGQMVASQANSDQASNAPFDVIQSWIPTGAGNYLVTLRAIDRQGSAGQSEPTRIEVGQRAYTYEAQEGDTVEFIAEQLGTTPEDLQERNPGIGAAPIPGTPMDVPGFPPSDAGGDDDPPRVDPPPPSPPPSGDETPADPASPPWWSLLPLPDNFVCLFNPDFCSGSTASTEPVPAPSAVSAVLDDSCRVTISWQDNAENEMGFRLYRIHLGTRVRWEPIALLSASPGRGTRLSFLDERLPNGRFLYTLTAYNSSGEYYGPPSELITASCRLELVESISLSVEATEMNVRDPYERLYCYFSLANSPFERVPFGTSFLELDSGIWNIAAHFGGENKRIINVHHTTPFDLIVECMGWQGETLVNLGRFSRSHPPEEWDGRLLTAGPADGSFRVSYRINSTDPEDYETALWPEEDASIPRPFDLRPTESAYHCAGVPPICRLVEEPGIRWTAILNDPPTVTREPLYFNVYARRADEGTPYHYFSSDEGHRRSRFWDVDGYSEGTYVAPQALIARRNCDVSIFYSVRTVVEVYPSEVDPSFDEETFSPASEELEIPSLCPQLEITLLSLHVLSARDGDPDEEFCLVDCGRQVEAYGWIQIGERRIRWNDHCDGSFGGGCLTSGPSHTDLPEGSTIIWENEYLNTGSGGGTGQNVFRIPIPDDGDLTGTFRFDDHDPTSPDDFWCGWNLSRSSIISLLPARSQEEWLAVDRGVQIRSPNGNCQLDLYVRGVPY